MNEISKLGTLNRYNSADPLIKRIYDRILTTAHDVMSVEHVIVFAINRSNDRIYSKFDIRGRSLELSLNEGITGWVARTGLSAIVNEPKLDHRYYPYFDRTYKFVTNNMLGVPILNANNRSIGVLTFVNKVSDFDNEDLELATSLSSQMSVAFENAILYDDLMSTFRSLVEVMAVSIDERHPTSSGHSRRVAKYSALLAIEMDMSDEFIELVSLAALLHDYGKISIPDSILKKDGQLSDDEFEIMKGHALSTYNILKRVHFTEEMAQIPKIAAMHHEHWNGKGYPFGLKAEEIPLGARIIAVADVYDAMTTWREYHDPISEEHAHEIIINGKGSKFDPKVVEAFDNIFHKKAFSNIK